MHDSLIFRCVIPETILLYASAGRITKSAEERQSFGPVWADAMIEAVYSQSKDRFSGPSLCTLWALLNVTLTCLEEG